MGADFSLPISGIPNPTTIYNQTQPTIDIMNKVLDFILKNADYRDMVALSNPKECEKWIVIGEDKLKTVFQRIRVIPSVGAKGILYLRKVDELKQFREDMGCKLLSFFFVRLFQVVGALSLSIMDTKIPDAKNYLEVESIQQRKGIPFFKPLPEKQFSFFGGEIEQSNIGSYPQSLQIFRRYLTRSGDKYMLTTIKTREKPAQNVPGYTIELRNNKLYILSVSGISTIEFELTVTESQQFIIDVLKRNGKEYPYNERFNYSIQTEEKITVSFESSRSIDFVDFIVAVSNKIRSLPPSQTIKILKELNYLEQSRIKPNYYKIKGTDFATDNDGIFVKESNLTSESPKFLFSYPIKKDSTTFEVFISFNLLIAKNNDKYTVEITNLDNTSSSEKLKFEPSFDFEKADMEESDANLKTDKPNVRNFTIKSSGFSSYTSEPTNRRQTIPMYLKSMFDIIKNQALNTLELGPLKSKLGYLNPIDDSKADSRLKTKELWTTLIRSPPVKAFCTARALQLLNISGLQQTVPKEVIPLIYNTKFDLIKNGSLPTPNQPITTSASIKALASLYNDMSNIDPSIKSYSEAKKISLGKMITSFLGEEMELKSLVEIIEKDGSQIGSLSDRSKIAALRNQARLLFQTQFDHTRKVNTLLKKIFVFGDQITLNSNILASGVSGIEEIASEARELLTDYYSKCQIEYNKGVKIVTAVPPPAVATNSKN